MNRRERRQEGDSPVERLRIERTELSQDEFAMKCGIPRATYHRWISGRTVPKLTLFQIKALCQELHIESVEELPDSFAFKSDDE